MISTASYFQFQFKKCESDLSESFIEAVKPSTIDGSYDFIIVGTVISSAVLGVLFSVIVVKRISSGIWFFTYQFAMWPMPVIYPFLIFLTVAIPTLLYRQIARASIIERLRQ